MNKRGLTLEFLARMTYGAFVFLLLAGALWTLWAVFLAEEKTPAISDLNRVKTELEAAELVVCLEVPTQGVNYTMLLLPTGNDERQCATKACICLKEGTNPLRCKAIKGIKKKCTDGTCVTKKTQAQVVANPLKVCRRTNNELYIT